VTARIPLAHLPTPLEPLPHRALGLAPVRADGAPLPRLWIKRDDCTGLAGGGNKTRKLEFLLGQARAEKADTVITFGALQSNHARQTAAACARLGLDCHLVLTDKVPGRAPEYFENGNLRLDRLLGARIHRLEAGADAAGRAAEIEADIAAAGGRAMRIPVGGSNGTGALGYARAAEELHAQCTQLGFVPDYVVTATSSGGTQAGLIAGFRALGALTRVLGVNVSEPPGPAAAAYAETLLDLTTETLDRLGRDTAVTADDVLLWHEALGPGYGEPDAGTLTAVGRMARTTGILCDPVYSGKGLAGLRDWLQGADAAAAEDVVFLHTGGSTALFVYGAELASRAP
jgi:L-cysteate sulfo-lyase